MSEPLGEEVRERKGGSGPRSSTDSLRPGRTRRECRGRGTGPEKRKRGKRAGRGGAAGAERGARGEGGRLGRGAGSTGDAAPPPSSKRRRSCSRTNCSILFTVE